MLQITPIENLYIGAAILTGWNGELADVFKYSQYAFGYDIPGIGLARFGYFGDQDQKIQVAFALKAVEGVFVDFGFTFKTAEALQDGKGDNIQINLVGSVDLGMIGLWFGIDGQFGKKDAGSLSFGLNPTFKLDFADIGLGFYMTLSFVEDAKPSFGFDLYISKDVGGGTIKAGVAAAIVPNETNGDKTDIRFSLPIEITYSIW
jgi:hypothetical protein